ncbi:hypothetical protein [Ferrimonas marina]|uniref:Uncharacterized protein n=1 Tax=Ferrimonas marina TaxID=299255 RepID=A0A1M5UGQ6_9GAMM|nr:hypothetical protein [Ferrimonas marina]SHH61823.1 hypothetical protein SAMN02745129_2549 [Ferrimonas marina]
MDFYEAWHFLVEHRIFNVNNRHILSGEGAVAELGAMAGLEPGDELESRRSWFDYSLQIEVVRVDPATGGVSENPEINTATRVSLECGQPVIQRGHEVREEHDFPGGYYLRLGDEETTGHDIELDVSGETFEQAIIALAGKVRALYGEDVEGALFTLDYSRFND